MQLLDNRQPLAMLLVLASIVVFIVSFWGVAVQNLAEQQRQAIAAQRLLWQQLEPESYRYKIGMGCMVAMSVTVTVNHGVAHFEPSGVIAVNTTIDDVFDAALNASRNAATMELTYHPEYAFPQLLSVDWSKEVMDDECYYEVSDFEVIPSAAAQS